MSCSWSRATASVPSTTCSRPGIPGKGALLTEPKPVVVRPAATMCRTTWSTATIPAGGRRAAPCSRRPSRCTRSSASCAATSRAAAGPSTARPSRCAAFRLPAGLGPTATNCPESDLHAGVEGPDGRARREHHLRAHRRARGPRGGDCAAGCLAAGVLEGLGDRRGPRGDPRRHEVRVRRRPVHRISSRSQTRCSPPTGSRYWDKTQYDAGDRGVSFDKQIVRDWLAANWDKNGHPARTAAARSSSRRPARYRDLIERLTSAGDPRPARSLLEPPRLGGVALSAQRAEVAMQATAALDSEPGPAPDRRRHHGVLRGLLPRGRGRGLRRSSGERDASARPRSSACSSSPDHRGTGASTVAILERVSSSSPWTAGWTPASCWRPATQQPDARAVLRAGGVYAHPRISATTPTHAHSLCFAKPVNNKAVNNSSELF